MPVMRISLRADTPADTRRAIADGAHRALVESLGVPEHDRFQVIQAFPAEAMIMDAGYLGVPRQNVVLVEITLARGRNAEKKATLFAAMANRLARRPEGCAARTWRSPSSRMAARTGRSAMASSSCWTKNFCGSTAGRRRARRRPRYSTGAR